jgi:hypothetical protein
MALGEDGAMLAYMIDMAIVEARRTAPPQAEAPLSAAARATRAEIAESVGRLQALAERHELAKLAVSLRRIAAVARRES